MSDEKTTEFVNDRGSVTLRDKPIGVDVTVRDSVITYTKAYPVKFQKLVPEAKLPERGTPQSAGYDLFCSEAIEIRSGETKLVRLGFATEMHPEIHGRIESRSGRALSGAVVMTGVIDADYRGEWKVILRNMKRPNEHFNFMSDDTLRLAVGDKVAQVVFRETINVSFSVVDALNSSERGGGGFGSTGT